MDQESNNKRLAAIVTQQNYANLELHMQTFIWKRSIASRDAKMRYIKDLKDTDSLEQEDYKEAVRELHNLSKQVERQGLPDISSPLADTGTSETPQRW